MAYLRIAEARAAAQSATTRVQKSASTVLREEARSASSRSSFDVFLSHSFDDAEVILGVKKLLETLGLSVYVDWIDDAALDRSTVSSATAKVLRARLRSSTSLVYAHSANATNSKWMPWELGYFDGFRPNFVWVLPLVTSYDSEFKGQEYVGIYRQSTNLQVFLVGSIWDLRTSTQVCKSEISLSQRPLKVLVSS